MKANKPTKKAAPTTKTATTASAQGRRADGGVPASKFQLPHCAGSTATRLHGKASLRRRSCSGDKLALRLQRNRIRWLLAN